MNKKGQIFAGFSFVIVLGLLVAGLIIGGFAIMIAVGKNLLIGGTIALLVKIFPKPSFKAKGRVKK